TDENILAHRTMKKLAYPLRVVSLLRGNTDEEGGPVDVTVYADIFRTSGSSDWFVTVRDLAGLARRVVMDCRQSSEHIEREVELVLQPQLRQKTVFVANE